MSRDVSFCVVMGKYNCFFKWIQVVVNKFDFKKTNEFIQIFNAKERSLHIRAFLIHGRDSYKEIEKLIVDRNPDIISRISKTLY